MLRQKSIDYFLWLAFVFIYVFLGYFVSRSETALLFTGYFTAFGLYLFVLAANKDSNNINFWIASALVFRAALLFSIPNLSDDFYRYIWDGRLLSKGVHPFSEVPSYYIANHLPIPGIDDALFSKLNSPDYFTIYPPLSQYVFWLAARLSPENIYGSLLVLKVINILSEIGSILLMGTLLEKFKMPRKNVLIYALNPLIILELTGNVHLEALMIFLVILGVKLILAHRAMISGLCIASAICVKIIPLIFVPVLFHRLERHQAVKFCVAMAVASVLLFLPLIKVEIIRGFSESIGYYFDKFEFNAGLYYIIRWIGYGVAGFNIIQFAGPSLGLIAFIIILSISFARDRIDSAPETELFVRLLLVHLTYCLFTTTLHPWYISTLLMISVFTAFRFTVLWSATIFLTYAGYTTNEFHENLWLTFIEYISVLGYLAYEFIWQKKYSLLRYSS